MLSSKSVKDCRLRIDDPVLPRIKCKTGLTTGLVDLADVWVDNAREVREIRKRERGPGTTLAPIAPMGKNARKRAARKASL